MIQVSGSTAAHFTVLDENGQQAGYQFLNEPLVLAPGRYQLRLNNSLHAVEVLSGQLVKCSTGTLMITGNVHDKYHIMDSVGKELAQEVLGKPLSFFPGWFKIMVNETEISGQVRLNELTEIRTGTLVVRGTTGEFYYVLDNANKQLSYNSLEKPLAFLPGTFVLKVNNTSLQAEVLPGKVTEILTGNILVNGLTEEYYYVTDTLDNALNYQTLNKPLAFLPGSFQVKVNNTIMKVKVSSGETKEFQTGTLMLTGGGTGYYYVFDDTGAQLNYNSLNKSLSFFPSEYTVKLGPSTRKATVTAGKLTAIDAFNQ